MQALKFTLSGKTAFLGDLKSIPIIILHLVIFIK